MKVTSYVGIRIVDIYFKLHTHAADENALTYLFTHLLLSGSRAVN